MKEYSPDKNEVVHRRMYMTDFDIQEPKKWINCIDMKCYGLMFCLVLCAGILVIFLVILIHDS